MSIPIGKILLGYGGYLALKNAGKFAIEMNSTEPINPHHLKDGECKMQCLECGVVFKGCLTPDCKWVDSLESKRIGHCPNCGEHGKVSVISEWTREDSLDLLKVGHPKILKKPSPPSAPEAPKKFSFISVFGSFHGMLLFLFSISLSPALAGTVIYELFFKPKPMKNLWGVVLVCILFPGISALMVYFNWKWHKQEVEQYNKDMKEYKKAMEEYNKRYKI